MGHPDRNLFYSEIYRAAQNTGDDFKKKKKLLSLKGISCLQVIFVLIWMRQMLIWFNLQRDGIGNGLSNINNPIAESLQLEMSVLHHSMSILQSSRPFLADSWLGNMQRKNT